MMENIETLLAAVAAVNDDVSAGQDVRSPNSGCSPGIQEVSCRSKVNSGDHQLNSSVGAPHPPQATVSSSGGQATGDGEKKRRGRPPRGQMALNSPPQKRVKVEDEEEDVCFICFDGGSLVLCDRKGCPKAYHPACIKRDDEFFKSKAKWICGWHLCSVCCKASHYICYTCPYSLCKGCTKDTEYLSVRRNKGFCSTCMKTIMLIEKKEQANNESVQVDFDDVTSWEYLFKMYWVSLKEKLSLSLTELEHAKRPCTPVVSVASKRHVSRVSSTAFDGQGSVLHGSREHLELNKPPAQSLHNDDDLSIKSSSMVMGGPIQNGEHMSSMHLELNKPHMDSSLQQTDDSKTNILTPSSHAEKLIDNEGRPVQSNGHTKHSLDKESADAQNHKVGEWASKELMEFVRQEKDGDLSVMSQFEVQTLVLKYIKRNRLRNPDQKCQIICDSRLRNLFGKERVGHIEMLKLLEYHVRIDDASLKNCIVPAGFVGSSASDNEFDEDIQDKSVSVNSRKRKSRRKNTDKGPKADSTDYAAIDRHNINLIFLKRNLLENLSKDKSDFADKVIGSIVRIRVPTGDQKHDLHRLVQVVGTNEASEPYKIRDLTLNLMLEVFNLDKKELVSLDSISNDEFTEEECRRLHQSIQCGLVKRLTVGEVQKKAMTLQASKVNDGLDSEIQRLKHLRDRASENGRKKELRECVEKLQLLHSPEERQRRISQVPDVHPDQKMDPDYKPGDVKAGHTTKRRNSSSRHTSPKTNGKDELNKQEPKRRKTASGSNKSNKHSTGSIVSNALPDSAGTSGPDHIETERLWHYRDPSGKIQGPFSMSHLRKWSMSGFFPNDMRIWTNHEQFDSLLLTDALKGQFHAASDLCGKTPKSEENLPAVECKVFEDSNQNSGDGTKTLTSYSNGNALTDKSIGVVTAESTWPQIWDMLKESGSGDVQTQNVASFPGAEPTLVTRTDQGRSFVDLKPVNGVAQNNLDMHGLAKQPNIEVRKGHSTEEIGKHTGSSFAIDLPSPTPSTAAAEDRQPNSSVSLAQKTSFLELLRPAARSNSECQGVETIDSKGIPAEPSWSMASTLVLGGTQMPIETEEWCGYSPTPSKPPGHEWGDTSLVYDPLCKPLEASCENGAIPTSGAVQIPATQSLPNWLLGHEPIELDVLSEESMSDLLAEVDAMESQGALASSPISALKFAREYLDDCKDDCFSSIDEFSSAQGPLGSDVLSSSGEIQHLHQVSPQTHIDGFDFFGKSNAHSYSSSGSETKPPVHSQSEFHPSGSSSTMHEMVGETTAQAMMPPDSLDPGWGTLQGNINLVTVQGNVNLVLGGPVQGMTNLNWGMNPGTNWVNPPAVHNRSSPMIGQRKFNGERFPNTRGANEPGFGRGQPLWNRQPYGNGGYARPLPKGQRVCKFYESGHCKKGSSCDYLHPREAAEM